MVNGLKFPSRFVHVEPIRDTGTKSERLCGLAVQACRRPEKSPRREYEAAGQPKAKSLRVDRQEKLMAECTDVRTGNRHRWVRRVASGERVKRGQGTRHNDPVTSEEGMSIRVKGLPRSLGGSQ